MSQVKYKRIILKISGEALAGDKGNGINPTVTYCINSAFDIAIPYAGSNK